MVSPPRATVVVPTLNEIEDIEDCLRAILDQDLSPQDLEVIVCDGGSSDGTPDRAEEVLRTSQVSWNVRRQVRGGTSGNLNAGLQVARAPVLCRVDARSIIPRSYVRRCVELLGDPSITVCGGAQVARTNRPDAVGRGIERALNNRFVMGGSRYRSRRRSGPADTVYLGAFRTEDLRSVGGWDERMISNQDFELNARLSERGTVWFDDAIPVVYRPRRTLVALFAQYRRFGRAKVAFWRTTGRSPLPRQWVILVVPAGTAAGLSFWASRGHRGRRSAQLVVLGAAGLLAVDAVGSEAAPRCIVDRLTAAVASGLIVTGWLSGVGSGLVDLSPGARSAQAPG